MENKTNIQQAKTVTAQLGQDTLSSLLIVSLAINVALLTVWIILQMTTQYDSQLVRFFGL